MKQYLTPATWLFLGLWLVLLVGGRSRFFQDPGTFWHVAVGNRIIDEGFFDTDPYTFTFAGKKWIPHQWLGECTMAVVDNVAGFDGLLLWTATLLAAVYTGLGVRLIRSGLHPSVSVVLVAAAVAASSGHFHIRPHLATIVGMAVVMVYLTDIENGRIPVRRLAWFIPVVWLWSNIHGGVLGGLATMAVAIAGWTFFRLIRRESPVQTRSDFAWLVGIWLACVAVCFANPYFHRLPWSWVEIYQMSSLPGIIKEHSRVDPADWAGLSILAFGVLYIVLLLTVPIRRFRIVWFLPVIWFALAYLRVRHAPLFAVLAVIGIADFFPVSRVAASLVRRNSDLFDPQVDTESESSAGESVRPFLLPAALVLVGVFLQLAGATIPVLGRGWARLDPKIWPVDLLPELKAHQYDHSPGTRVFCEYAYGGFLIYHCPGYRVFIDDRCELFGDEFLKEFQETKGKLVLGLYEDPAEPFAEWQATYGRFDFALVETQGAFDEALEHIPAWEIVRRTDTATLYRKSSLGR